MLRFELDEEKLEQAEAEQSCVADLRSLLDRLKVSRKALGDADFEATAAECLQLAYLTGASDCKAKLTGMAEVAAQQIMPAETPATETGE